MDLKKIIEKQHQVVSERDWDKFHTPKNLVMALSGEVGELTELFQWLSDEESFQITQGNKAEALRHELGDIFYYLVRLCDKLDIDLEAAFWEKIAISEKRYPVDRVKGSAKKYNEY